MKIYRTSDRIPVKIGELTFWLSPMSWGHRAEIVALARKQAGIDATDANKAGFLTLKYTIKEIEGLENSDGSPYVCEYEQSGCLTDDCVDDLYQLDILPQLVQVGGMFLNGLPKGEIEGVHIDLGNVKNAKKKQS